MREKDVSAKSSAYFVRQYERSQLKTNIKKENLRLASSLPYISKATNHFLSVFCSFCFSVLQPSPRPICFANRKESPDIHSS